MPVVRMVVLFNTLHGRGRTGDGATFAVESVTYSISSRLGLGDKFLKILRSFYPGVDVAIPDPTAGELLQTADVPHL